MSPGRWIAVALGGAVGGVARMGLLAAWPAGPDQWPVTLVVLNATGSGLIGIVLAFSESGRRYRLPPTVSLGLMTGFCGAFTTLSTFAVEVLGICARVGWMSAAGYVSGSILSWVTAAAVGLLLGRCLNPRVPSGCTGLPEV